MPKVRVRDLDQAACRGERSDVDGPCPHFVASDADTGRGVVDRLARIEGAAIEAATGSDPGKCGACGCPVTNLSALNVVPPDCPRIPEHGGEAD